MKITKRHIENFFEAKKLAIAGVSRDPQKFGYLIFNELTNKGYEVLPINPNAKEINGVACFKSVSGLPADVSSLLIVTHKHQTDSVLREAIGKGIKNIWVQQMSETEETIKIAEEYQIEIIYKKCIYMFAEPVVGFHKFHRTILKIFGQIPR